jgi:integrase
VTRIFNRLVDAAADSRRIRLHDVRHTYSTLSRLIEDAVGGSEGTAPEAC